MMSEQTYPSREQQVERLRALLLHAYRSAGAVRTLFDTAGVKPEDVREVVDLDRLPVTKKERLLELQQENPPFGGFLATDVSSLRRIFVSPGPLFDPQPPSHTGFGFRQAFHAAGLSEDDILLNTWSYHLVPAGLVMDEALIDLGVTVVPGGVGNTEQQAELIIKLGVTAISASTGFFMALVEQLESLGYTLPEDWNVRTAFLGGELGDWMTKRRRLEEQFKITTSGAYATADIGLIGYECAQREGYHVTSEAIVQICDPDSGASLPDGSVGEVVVTPFNEAYPLVRFGTGDLSYLLGDPCACGDPAARLAAIQGRVGLAVKAREIFIYPVHVQQLSDKVGGVGRVQVLVRRPENREEIVLRAETGEEADRDAIRRRLEQEFRSVTRLRVDEVEFCSPETIPVESPFVVDDRD